MWGNAFLLAFRAIRRNLLRSFLTVLGIVIGVGAVVTMVTLGNGATQMVSDSISSLGSNLLVMRPSQRLGPGSDAAGSTSFRMQDVDALREQIPSLKAVAPSVSRGITLVSDGKNWSSSVVGTNNEYFITGNWNLADGRVFTQDELNAGRSVCVIGQTVRQELFGAINPIGDRIRIRNFDCEIIGLLSPKGQGAMGMDQDDVVLLPLTTMQRRIAGNTNVSTVLLSMTDNADVDQTIRSISQLMRERRKLASGDPDNFSIMDTKQIAQTLSGTIQTMTGLLGAVAAVSLLVGGIGIMNIMLVSVTERTREIGIRLAIGALEREVLLQFLIEAVVLSAIGGLVGLILAFLACLVVTDLMSMPFLFNPAINVTAFVFSALIGVVFGFFPARRAARLDPIDALRHE
ncbi:ABC transporter permease [Orrella marina]|uniref:Multidrug ABC transporter substrate-binding protein n=1 Tax=Orrella marina TaxID=2163011 RepID=A0A2R4XF48_9BURK|nr:ABC transporter permease [Orrella marina]AWB32425.1 multidrug ABC transporter substrate-binding protein [Orrella marina]